MRWLAARWIVPINRPPIQGGWVQLQGEKVVDVGSGKPPAQAEQLGDVALLPRLVNAHTHLEFSDCRQPIGQQGTLLSDWIGEVVAARAGTTAEQKVDAIQAGMNESREYAVALIGEITTPPCQYSEVGDSHQICPFAEVLGLSPQRYEERIAAATEHLNQNPTAGISPHAPYSTSPAAIARCVDLAGKHQRGLAMHVAESPAERELLTTGQGPFAEALKNLGAWQQGLFPWSGEPIKELIDRLAAAPRVLLIHGNDLSDDEITQLAQHPHITIVYCPRTHHFFQYDRHPVDRLIAAGVSVALGTDSRASNPDLNVWGEVQYLLKHRADLDPNAVLSMATTAGAHALGRSDLGRIQAGATASFAFLRTQATTIDDLFASFAETNALSPLP